MLGRRVTVRDWMPARVSGAEDTECKDSLHRLEANGPGLPENPFGLSKFESRAKVTALRADGKLSMVRKW